jgi:hypothetical protein
MCTLSVSKKIDVQNKAKREHCNTHTSRERERERGCITYYIVIDQHFPPRVQRERERKKNDEEKNKKKKGQMTIHLSFVDNRDVTTTTTTLDTSNNIYQMVREKKNTTFVRF